MKQKLTTTLLGATTFLFTLQSLATGQADIDKKNREAIEQRLLNISNGNNKNGIRVQPVSMGDIDRAAKVFDGKVTVDFGNSKLPYKNGTEKKVERISEVNVSDAAGNTKIEKVILAPIQPNMSISVIGNWPGYCASYIPTALDKSPILGGASLSSSQCVKGNEFIRITKPGTYVVFPNYSFEVIFGKNQYREKFGIKNSRMIVNIEDGENKIIPLSKITITGAENQEKEVLHYLTTDLQAIEEQIKSTYISYAYREQIPYGYSEYNQIPENCSFEEFKRNLKFEELKSEGSTPNFYQVLWLKKCNSERNEMKIDWRYDIHLKEMDHDIYPFKGNYTYSVFPGVYSIHWLIDNQQEIPTRGIQIN